MAGEINLEMQIRIVQVTCDTCGVQTDLPQQQREHLAEGHKLTVFSVVELPEKMRGELMMHRLDGLQ